MAQTVLDVYNRAIILVVAEIELSNEEDSVQSIASLATKDGLLTFAGVNSSQANQNAGKNEHFRAYEVKLPARKRLKLDEAVNEKGFGKLLGKRSLFRSSSVKQKEAYQRILRLSPAKLGAGIRRIGAVASGMSKPAEIVVFDATAALPDEQDVLARVQTEKDNDVLDLDIATSDQDLFSVAWCTDYDIYEQTYEYNFEEKRTKKTPAGPRRITQRATLEHASDDTPSPKFRCIRFLNSQNILALINLAGKKGSELRIYHLYPTGPAATTFQMRLPSHIKQAVSMDVCALDSNVDGDRQILVAVAGQDISITTYLIDYKATTETFSKFHLYHTTRHVHKHQMTKICFAPFPAPQANVNGKASTAEKYAKLASVSYGNSVVVDSFPLFKIDTKSSKSRYVLVDPSAHNRQRNIIIAVLSFVVLVLAYLSQQYVSGTTSVGLKMRQFVRNAQQGFQEQASTVADVGEQVELSAASILESSIPSELPGTQKLQDLLNLHPEPEKAIVIGEGEDSTLTLNVHDDKAQYLTTDPHAKHWDQLQEHQRSYVRERLQQAGHWAESEGETVLKGVLWSQWAGLVGEAAGEILREL